MAENLRDMSLFVEVARAGSFTKAAESLDLPLSSLSRRFAEFERRIGLQLINRSTRKLELTEIGREYFEECERLVLEAAEVHERLKARRDELAGPLKLSLTPDFGSLLFAPLLAEFALLHPRIHFILDLTPNLVDLISENIDVAIRFGNPSDSRLTMRALGTVHHGLFASPRYLELHGLPADPAELAQHEGIGIRHAAKVPPVVLTRDMDSVELNLPLRFQSNNMSMLRRLALMDMGIAVLPEVFARVPVAEKALVAVLPEWKFPSVPVIALTATRLLPARCRAFIEFISLRTHEVL
jgi:DNA-binding transcriptional LysR family regulator